MSAVSMITAHIEGVVDSCDDRTAHVRGHASSAGAACLAGHDASAAIGTACLGGCTSTTLAYASRRHLPSARTIAEFGLAPRRAMWASRRATEVWRRCESDDRRSMCRASRGWRWVSGCAALGSGGRPSFCFHVPWRWCGFVVCGYGQRLELRAGFVCVWSSDVEGFLPTFRERTEGGHKTRAKYLCAKWQVWHP